MPQSELHRRRGAGRAADYRDFLDTERIQQARMRIGLRCRRSIWR
jgi:hypothetical protein